MGAFGSATSTSTGANQTVTLPEPGLTIIGISCPTTTPGYISLPLDATRNAIIPFNGLTVGTAGQNQGLNPTIAAFTLKVKGTTLTFSTTNITLATNMSLTFYYGTPWPGSVDAELLTGVASAQITSTSSAAANISLPGKSFLTGIAFAFGTTSTNLTTYGFAQFTTAAGKLLTFTFGVGDIPNPGSNTTFPLTSLDNIPSAATVSVTTQMAVAGAMYVILYYKLQ